MNKYEFWKSRFENVNELHTAVKNVIINRYYNIWMNKFKWSGLDEDNSEQQQNYIMRKFWNKGTVAVRKIKNIDTKVFCDWTMQEQNIYDFPETVMLINKRNAPQSVIPSTKPQRVNKDCAILWCEPNQKPIKFFVDYYADRIAQIEMIINTNLTLQKMPFIVAVDETDKDQMEDYIERILNNEVVVTVGTTDLNKIKALIMNAPYLVDKLRQHEVALENDLLTFLGIDNSGDTKSAQLTVDEVNANNDCINDYGRSIEDELKRWIERANKVLGCNISIEPTSKPVDTVKDQEVLGSQPNEEEEEEEEIKEENEDA